MLAPAATTPIQPELPPSTSRATVSLILGWALLWRVSLFFMIWGLFMAPLFLLGSGPLKPWLQVHPFCARLFPDSVVLLTLLSASGFMLRWIDRRPLRLLGFGATAIARDFALGLGIGASWLLASLGVAWTVGWISPQTATVIPWAGLDAAAVALILNVVCQQLLLCGYIFERVRARAGFGPAAGVSILLFCAYHAAAFHGAWLPALNVALAALVFCSARQLADNLWLPIGLHAAWNYLLGPVLGLTVSGNHHLGSGWQPLRVTGPAWATGGDFGFEGSLIVTLITALLAVILVRFVQRSAFSAHASKNSW